jgi:hypothetical protein
VSKFVKNSKDSQPNTDNNNRNNNNNGSNTSTSRVCMQQLKYVFCTPSTTIPPCKFKNGTCRYSHAITRKYDVKLYDIYMRTINSMKSSSEKDELLHVIVSP